MRIQVTPPPLAQQIAAIADDLEMSRTEVANALLSALERPVVEPLHTSGP